MISLENVKTEPYVKMDQLGFIDISMGLIENNTKQLFKMMKTFIVIDIRENVYGVLTYKCLCKRFRSIAAGEQIPKYNVIYDTIKDLCTVEEIKE
ncbi:hypothetical protein [Clostridium rectalis]|uniref:hypothetical protein n=1 Tax=Clostridium rectalis TaxID=2040295 RepID=UPI000F63CF82|nr:hypothetical protein [Clostridium rectalis]